MKNNTSLTRNDITTTNTTPVVLTDARRPWARTSAMTDDPWVVGPDGIVTRRSDLLGRDADPWDTRR